MTQAANYEILLDGARNQAERNNLLDSAHNESIAGEFDADDRLILLEFPDGSELQTERYIN